MSSFGLYSLNSPIAGLDIGTSSVVIGHRIVDADGGLHCDGSVVAVWIDRRSGRPTPLPDGVRRASEALLQG